MKAQKFQHEPAYFQFFIQDSEWFEEVSGASFDSDTKDHGFLALDGKVVVFVASEFSPIEIEVQVLDAPPEGQLNSRFDRIIECPLFLPSGQMILCGCPDGPVYGRFGEFKVAPGAYRLRIHYGGLDSVQPDATSSDFYLIQAWPSDDAFSEIIKPYSVRVA